MYVTTKRFYMYVRLFTLWQYLVFHYVIPLKDIYRFSMPLLINSLHPIWFTIIKYLNPVHNQPIHFCFMSFRRRDIITLTFKNFWAHDCIQEHMFIQPPIIIVKHANRSDWYVTKQQWVPCLFLTCTFWN